MEEIALTRTGQAPLVFAGELLAEEDGRLAAAREHNRWHELALYRTAGGRYVLAVCYRTCWQGELGHEWAEVLDGPSAVAAALREYAAQIPGLVQGFPPGAAYAEKQARLLDDVTRRYQALVSDLLAADPAFAERVE